jgi:hypothetical protein
MLKMNKDSVKMSFTGERDWKKEIATKAWRMPLSSLNISPKFN